MTVAIQISFKNS